MAFGFYKAVTVRTGQVPSAQSNFPAVLPFLAGDADFATVANGGKEQSSSGYGIRPYADSALTTPLAFELVPGSYDATTGAFEMWVNMTAVDAAVVYMAVGDSGISTDGSSSATWDSSYGAVWHANETSGTTLRDSTSNANDGSESYSTNPWIAGQIGGGKYYSDSTADVAVPAATSLRGMSQLSTSGWVNVQTLTGYDDPLWMMDYGGSNNWGITLHWDSSPSFYTAGNKTSFGGYDTMPTGSWQFVTVTYDGTAHSGNLKWYRNGALKATVDADFGSIGNATGRFVTFHGNINGSNYYKFDEVRVKSTVLSADWITTEYNNQSDLSTFWSKGSLIPVGGGGSIIVPVFLLMAQQGWGQP